MRGTCSAHGPVIKYKTLWSNNRIERRHFEDQIVCRKIRLKLALRTTDCEVLHYTVLSIPLNSFPVLNEEG
jgi:hypothetical protein